jgi:hypothetical protein
VTRPLAVARRLAPALAIAALAAAVLAAPARAGTFRVSQCHTADGASASRGYQGDLWWVEAGWSWMECGAASDMIRIGTANLRLAEYGHVSAYVTLPARMPATSMRTAWLDWRFNPQGPSTNSSWLELWASGAVLLIEPPGFGGQTRRELPAGTRTLEAKVWCSPVNGIGWCNWPGPLLDIRGLTLELEESGAPSATASGELTAAGPHAGIVPLEVTASDGDSGVSTVAVSIAGTQVGTLRPAGGCRDDRLPPCPQSLHGTIDVDTRAVADGVRRLRLVVADAAGNSRTVDAGEVEIRNQVVHDAPSPPSPAPVDAGGVPTAVPPQALFPANPLGGRGHVPNGSHASERARLTAWLEPGARLHGVPIRRRAVAVPQGIRVRIRGRLTDPRGRPIARAALAAIRREDARPWRAITGVRTRRDGRFTAFTRIGPSQQVQFVYYAFGDSTTGRRGPRLRVRVLRE